MQTIPSVEEFLKGRTMFNVGDGMPTDIPDKSIKKVRRKPNAIHINDAVRLCKELIKIHLKAQADAIAIKYSNEIDADSIINVYPELNIK